MKVSRWALLLGVLVACGDGGATTPPEDPNIPLAELCGELAEADCARLVTCDALYAPFDEALCRREQAAVMCGPVQAALHASVVAGSLEYFELAARDCKAAVAGLSCEVGLQHDLLALPACRAMVSAAGAAGDACYLGLDCTQGLYCDHAAACPGVCAELKGNNQPCTFGERCADDLYCDLTAMRCLARTDLGGTCGLALSGSACVDNTFCDRSNPATPVCARARGRNEGCTSNAECASGGLCLSNRCATGQQGDACLEPYHCQADLLCSGGACRAPGLLDDTCNPTGTPCGPGLTCTSTLSMTQCRPQRLLGQPCDMQAVCLLGSCVAGRCEAALDDGATCSDAAQCLPGRACEGGRCVAQPRDCRYPVPTR